MTRKLYTVTEVANILRVDIQTVRKLMDETLKENDHWFYVRGKRLIRIKETAVSKLMHDLKI